MEEAGSVVDRWEELFMSRGNDRTRDQSAF